MNKRLNTWCAVVYTIQHMWKKGMEMEKLAEINNETFVVRKKVEILAEKNGKFLRREKGGENDRESTGRQRRREKYWPLGHVI